MEMVIGGTGVGSLLPEDDTYLRKNNYTVTEIGYPPV